MQGDDFRIVELEPSAETAAAFARLAQDARHGKVIGAIIVAIHHRYQRPQNRRYSLVMTGAASRDPTLASGAVGACKVLIDELALQEAGLL